MRDRVKAALPGVLVFAALVGVALVPQAAKDSAKTSIGVAGTGAKTRAVRFWYFTLARCAPSIRAAYDANPAAWSQDLRVEKCREGEGGAAVCLISHLVDGVRRTDPFTVDCSTGKILQ